MTNITDLTGQRFGLLVVQYRTKDSIGPERSRLPQWSCRCDCEKQAVVTDSQLVAGYVTDCGCQTDTGLGGYLHPLYKTWVNMIDRCRNPRATGYKDYGGRGIDVCERWNEFRSFVQDMGPKPSAAHSIDRIDNDRGYRPDNCRWAERSTQSSNRRSTRRIDYRGQSVCISELARQLNVSRNTLANRIRSGWPQEQWGVSTRRWTRNADR